MSNPESALLLREIITQIAREVFQEFAPAYIGERRATEDAAAKLREQVALIKAKERITVKEAALLLSCSESHLRKLIKLARQGKTQQPIPYVELQGVVVFPPDKLLEWASPKWQPEEVRQRQAKQTEVA